MDPEGVKVRASQGLEAVDYFVSGYHVWARMIEALADLGYDTNDLVRLPQTLFALSLLHPSLA